MTGGLYKERKYEAETEGRQCKKNIGRRQLSLSQADTCTTDSSLTALRRSEPYQHFDFGLLASRIMR